MNIQSIQILRNSVNDLLTEVGANAGDNLVNWLINNHSVHKIKVIRFIDKHLPDLDDETVCDLIDLWFDFVSEYES